MAALRTRRAPRHLPERALSAAALVLAGLLAGAADDDRSWQVTTADVRVVCPMTVGGSFETKTSALTGTVTLAMRRPPAFSGTLAVDLTTLETGIGLRNRHLRESYLEVGRGAGYDRAVLSDIRLGDVDPDAFQGRTPFGGTLRLHGVTRAIAGEAEIRRVGTSVRVTASFPVVIPDFGIERPRYLGVGVKDQVQVHVLLVATPVTPPGGAQ